MIGISPVSVEFAASGCDTDFGGSAGGNLHEAWKLSGKDIAKAVIDIYRYPGLALVSRIEVRPFQPPGKDN